MNPHNKFITETELRTAGFDDADIIELESVCPSSVALDGSRCWACELAEEWIAHIASRKERKV